MSFLTTTARYSLRNATRGPSFLAAFHNSSLQMAPEPTQRGKEPAGQQSQQTLRQKMDSQHHWSEDVASWSESMVKADRGEMEGSAEVEMEEKKFKERRERESKEKKTGPSAG